MQTSRFLIYGTLNKSKAVIWEPLLTRPIIPTVIISPFFHLVKDDFGGQRLLFLSSLPSLANARIDPRTEIEIAKKVSDLDWSSILCIDVQLYMYKILVIVL